MDSNKNSSRKKKSLDEELDELFDSIESVTHEIKNDLKWDKKAADKIRVRDSHLNTAKRRDCLDMARAKKSDNRFLYKIKRS